MAKEIQLLTIRNLAELGDGDLEKDFGTILQQLVKDCLARPSVTKLREVKIVLQLTPVLKPDGGCDDVKVDVQVASKQPAKAIPTYKMRATVNGGLKFSPLSPDNPDQGGIEFD